MEAAKYKVGQSFFYDVKRDLQMILAFEGRPVNLRNIVWAFLACDAYMVLFTFRLRKFCKKYRIPFLNRLLRFTQTMLYSIELGIEIELGHGVYFVHTLGTVVGGNAVIGEGCVFFGNNTIGAARFAGSPKIGVFTMIGAGARIIGTIKIGDDCFIGANAVVVDDIDARKVAVGIPAKVIADNQDVEKINLMKRVI